MEFKVIMLSGLLFALCSCEDAQIKELDLSGEWQFQIDSLDQGISEQWFVNNLNDVIELPGSMAENGKGDEITVNTHWTGSMWNDSLWYKDPKYAKYREPGNVKVSFWLSPDKVYTGPAWYQKKVTIPTIWENQYISLELERPHWETTLWVDDKEVGTQHSLGTPHNYRLDKYLKPGEHTITLRIDNRVKDIDPGVDAHSISDNTQTNWNGIVGDIKLITSPLFTFKDVKLYPDVNNNLVGVKGTIVNFSGNTQKGEIVLQAKQVASGANGLQEVVHQIEIDQYGKFEIDYPMGDSPLLWDEFNPNLYKMQLRLKSDLGISEKEITFGMRDFKVDGKRFAINGRPVYLRGTLECSIFPLTGYPPTDVEEWKRILRTIQNHGLNHMRFHSYCPPEAAFQAADELGVYIQVEASAWATIGDGKPIDDWLYKEAEDIIDTYGNHPSFVMMAYGNEPSGKNHAKYLEKFVSHFKDLDSRRLYTSAAGWPLLDNLDYYNHKGPRIQGWAQELNSVINAEPPQTEFDYRKLIEETPMPYVSHEMGQWCVYPNFKEMSKYTGVLKPKNFEIFKETLNENHLGHLADSLLLASGKLQVLCYKADIEAGLRTKDMAGFQLLDLHDFPGQGTALIGVLDAFWEEKGYVTPSEFREFNSETVPLARLAKRIFLNNETLKASVEVAHYGEKPIHNVTPTWELTDKTENSFAKGEFSKTTIPVGNGFSLGEISVKLDSLLTPQKLVLTVYVGEYKNSWDVWVYPSENEPIKSSDNFRVVQKLDPRTLDYLNNGGNVLLTITKGDIKADKGGDIGVGFSSIFWNTSWTKGQKPHTLGILTNPSHPALAEFPTEYHSNWQWWDAMSHSNAIVLDDFSSDLHPIVRVIDDWFENRRTALLFEAKVGKGKLLFSGVDLHSSMEDRPEARQLLYSLKRYIVSSQFNPKIQLKPREIKSLLKY
ncbi:beta-galactosidase [Zobellia amurskyensis]|uniref:beta-galactosidase n=1 Tax=Zobellia amurskyensis TaxID=248905 RepID=A0A7X2ZTR2_9FLAO|nr:sugar-binding domain-containing protein [Zobellia amurskyensis]MUH36233.1 beta-galactosidase [Zobellia amurskyensis]